jgi:hypothetical protein
MKSRILLITFVMAVLLAIMAAPTYEHPLPASSTSSDYESYLGNWQLSAIDNRSLGVPINANVSHSTSNQIQIVMTYGAEGTTNYGSVANLQGQHFVSLQDNRGIYNVFKLTLLNSGSKLELKSIDPSQLEMDITNGVVPGLITPHSRGLKHFRITAASETLNNYLTNRIGAFTEEWVVLDRAN